MYESESCLSVGFCIRQQTTYTLNNSLFMRSVQVSQETMKLYQIDCIFASYCVKIDRLVCNSWTKPYIVYKFGGWETFISVFKWIIISKSRKVSFTELNPTIPNTLADSFYRVFPEKKLYMYTLSVNSFFLGVHVTRSFIHTNLMKYEP